MAVVTLWFHASDPERLAAILARYVVLTRGEPGCRNVDLCASVTRPNRILVIEKSLGMSTGHAEILAVTKKYQRLLERALKARKPKNSPAADSHRRSKSAA